MVSYYDELEIEDFAWDEKAKVFHYPCPCGDRFEISKSQLRDGEEIAICPSCSLIVRVIYDYLDWEDYASSEEEDEENESFHSAAEEDERDDDEEDDKDDIKVSSLNVVKSQNVIQSVGNSDDEKGERNRNHVTRVNVDFGRIDRKESRAVDAAEMVASGGDGKDDDDGVQNLLQMGRLEIRDGTTFPNPGDELGNNEEGKLTRINRKG